MSFKKAKYLLFLTLFVLGCKETTLKYADLSFPETKSLKGEVCNDHFLFNYPQAMFIQDSLLIVKDDNYGGMIHIFNKAGQYKRSAIEKGRGPGEIVLPISVDISGNKVMVCEVNLRRLIIYDLCKILNGEATYHTDEYSLRNEPYWIVQAIWYKDSSIVVKSNNDQMRYGLFIDNKVIPTYLKYPISVFDQEENWSVWDNFSRWKFKPDYSKMVTTTYIGSIMEIFNSESITNIVSEQLLPIHQPKYGLAEGARPKWITSSDDTVIGFQDLFVTDSQIYALIYGVNVNDMEANLPSIYVLSWNGEPKIKYQFKERLYTFSVDEQEKTIYAIVMQDDGNLSLYKYKM